jgi:hypothetical protein
MISTTFDSREALDTGRRVEGFVHYDRDGKAGSDAVSDECVGEAGQTNFWDVGNGMFFAAAGGILSTGADIVSTALFGSFGSQSERKRGVKLTVPGTLAQGDPRPAHPLKDHTRRTEPAPDGMGRHINAPPYPQPQHLRDRPVDMVLPRPPDRRSFR